MISVTAGPSWIASGGRRNSPWRGMFQPCHLGSTPFPQRLWAALEALYGRRPAKPVLFGSRARGDADPDSDFDVMVVLHGPLDDELERARYVDVAAELSLAYDTVNTPPI